jgi:hypothetical protein
MAEKRSTVTYSGGPRQYLFLRATKQVDLGLAWHVMVRFGGVSTMPGQALIWSVNIWTHVGVVGSGRIPVNACSGGAGIDAE